MKESTGELNMTVITVVAIAAIAALFVAFVLPRLRNNLGDRIKETSNTYTTKETCNNACGKPCQGEAPNFYCPE